MCIKGQQVNRCGHIHLTYVAGQCGHVDQRYKDTNSPERDPDRTCGRWTGEIEEQTMPQCCRQLCCRTRMDRLFDLWARTVREREAFDAVTKPLGEAAEADFKAHLNDCKFGVTREDLGRYRSIAMRRYFLPGQNERREEKWMW